MWAVISSMPILAAIDRMLDELNDVVMKNVHDVLPHMIERGTGDIIVTQFSGGPFPDTVGAGLRVVQMGDQLLCSDGPAAGFQARDPGGLHLTGSGDQRIACGLAAGEA